MTEETGKNEDVTKLSGTERFFRLFLGCQTRLYAFILMLVHNDADAEDLLQEVATAMWESFDQFEPDKSFAVWGMGIARNKISSYYRTRRRTRARLQQVTYNKIDDHATQSTDLITEWVRAIKKCVQRLGEHDRRIVLMRYEQNIALRKIAELNDRTPGGLYKTMARIHNKLRDCVRVTLAAMEAGYD